MSNTSSAFGPLIRAKRLAMDPPMTQKDLADRFKVHQPSVSAWELGKALPSLATMLELAALFGIEATLADVAEWMAETTEAVEV